MKIIRKKQMPDGTEILFEKWRPDMYIIAAYPIAQRGSKDGWVRAGETMRLTLTNFTDLRQAAGIFDGLWQGVISLADCVSYFGNGKKDVYYLGLEVDTQDNIC